ncbi:MAG: ABC transporter permease [Bacteroidia bacterium]|nr:ABC transporter permease [Bacteroidia bacterium]
MGALIKLAWRNVWRKKFRSMVVIAAIALGLWAGVFIMGFYHGIFDQKISDVISTEVSHLQFHQPNYTEEFDVKLDIPGANQLLDVLQKDSRVKQVAARTLSMAMLGAPKGNLGVKVNGIDTLAEAQIRGLDQAVIEGEFLAGIRQNPVLISQKLAEKLQLKLKSKIILQLQNQSGEITAGAFRVAGIFKTINVMYDEANVFVLQSDLQNLLGMPGGMHEVAVLLHENDQVEAFTTEMASKYPDLEVKSWMDLSPGMRYMVESMDTMMGIILSIILLALLFGIINTMLMAVLERVREIGMLMAVGMSRMRIFFMIILETVMLSLVGGPLGMLLGFICIAWTGHTGMNLSSYSEAMEQMGYSAIIHPSLAAGYYFQVAAEVILMALAASIYPALRALKLKPVEALRKI